MDKTRFQNLRIYQLSEKLGDIIWDIVSKWEDLPKTTIGKQLINSTDSIGANIAEGAGRGSPAENKRFAKIARGSLFETKHWLRRCYRRNLLTVKNISVIEPIINELTPKLSAYINSIKKNENKNS